MAVEWTKEQQNVIDFRDRNILVSAAAGSGKTAVLVERIIKRITEDENPIDIDKMLVVTFTKAAAAEMRERIGKAIDKKREENPDDERLEKQSTLLHNAQITTIDSFCLFVVRNYFGQINLDPNFRIADTGELKLLQKDTLSELFEEEYEKEDNEQFLSLIDAYSASRSDDAVKDMVEQIYNMSESDSWPKEWIKRLLNVYEAESADEFLQSDFMNSVYSYVKVILEDYRQALLGLLEKAKASAGLEKFVQTLCVDIEQFGEIDKLEGYGQLKEFFEKITFGRAPVIKGDVDSSLKDYIKDSRNEIKDSIKKLLNNYFSNSPEEMFLQIQTIKPYAKELIRLAIRYLDKMNETKRHKRIVSFSDIEHFALKIFVDENTHEITDTAKSFMEHFEEIMIDEYQDSNQVQEDILSAISKKSIGKHNLFMVGDVKQSIYRFRLARPEIFMEKYDTYDLTESKNQRIDLHNNFRSRREVLDFTNDIFYRIMKADLGKVEYDENAALNLGAKYPENSGMEPEILVIDKKDEELSEVLSDEDNDSVKVEALVVAQKIKALKESTLVTDKETNTLRPMKNSDIVILLRSVSSWGSEFAKVLADCGIPSYVESQTGYFGAYEVVVLLSLLQILDNPYQDIPMAAVLKSPIVGLDDEELAEIRIIEEDLPFSKAALKVMSEATEGALYDFYQIYVYIRSLVKDTSIRILLEKILEVTGFAKYVAAMPAGERRIQNINLLLEMAGNYESTSYKGLFHFIRYINTLKKYEVDFGEADVSGENDDVVRIMTIHKSKGLEFPVVFLSGAGKKFNELDSKGAMVLHSDLGMGLVEMHTKPRTKRNSLIKTEIASQIKRENLGEELRILYVALTRAKEKIIVTGTVSDYEKILKSASTSFSGRSSAHNYLEWIIPAIISYPDKYDVTIVGSDEIASRVIEDEADAQIKKVQMFEKIESADDNLLKSLTRHFEYEYPYKEDSQRKSKYSVSELKHDSMVSLYDATTGEAQQPDFLCEDFESYIPDFALEIEEEETDVSRNSNKSTHGISPGALRGTAIHRVMECLDFASIMGLDTDDDDAVKSFVEKEINRMFSQQKITEDMKELVFPAMIENFVKSPVAKRMSKAALLGNLFKEKPFVMEKDGSLIQGIIDVFWIEDDEIVLLDYKTDRVDTSQELIDRYKVQLELYAQALDKIFTTKQKTIKTKECMIYSFRLKEEITI